MKKPLSVRLALFSARYSWLVMGLWCLVMAALLVIGTSFPATTAVYNQTGGFDVESSRAINVFNENGQAPEAQEDFFVVITHPSLKARDTTFQATVEQLYQELVNFNYDGQPVFALLVNPYQPVPDFQGISGDGTTARLYGRIDGQTYSSSLNKKLAILKAKLADFKSAHPDFRIMEYSRSLSLAEANRNTQQSLQKSLAFTLIPTFLILLVVFGTLVAALIPLIMALTAITGTTGVILIYSNLSGNPNIEDAILISVLIGLAVAVDYSLFVISRYRQERANSQAKLKALEITSGTAGRAVFFSGILVAISMLGLLLLGGVLIPISLAIVVVVLLSVAGSVTFLPAVLALTGNKINWGRLPFLGRATNASSGLWIGLVNRVMRYPVQVTLLTSLLLLSLAVPVLHIRLGSSLFGVANLESSKTLQFMLQKWPEGTELKIEVVVTQADRPETAAAIAKFQAAALQIPGLNEPAPTVKSGNGKVSKLYFTQPGTANDEANQAVVNRLRTEVVPAYFGGLHGVEVYVGGAAAVAYDTNRYFTNPIVWVFVLCLSFGVLLVVFRSLIIAAKAVLLNLLSTGAAYGVVVLVFQDGVFGLKQSSFLENILPVFMFAIIFGLSMDYHLFILTRIKELRDRGAGNNEAVSRGIASTAGTITGAAAIMVIVFGDFFVAIDNTMVQQLGLGLAVAVMIDATVVRSMLLPALMQLMGDFNWWLPRFLYWLPVITLEVTTEAGQVLEETGVAIPSGVES